MYNNSTSYLLIIIKCKYKIESFVIIINSSINTLL